MSFMRWFIPCLLLCGLCAAVCADETDLATIHIGMKPKDLRNLLGEPTAIIIAQPPIVITNEMGQEGHMGGPGLMGGNPLGGGPMGMAQTPVEKPNTLVLITGEGNNRTETELPANAEKGSMGPGSFTPTATPSKTEQPSAATLPIWAYAVRVYKLALDQQQLIYRINSTYSLGITITGQGEEGRVSDIVACSFQPFTMIVDKTAVVLKTVHKAPNFTFASKHTQLQAATSKKVSIGASFKNVLQAHGWPIGFLPFSAEQSSFIPLGRLPQNATPYKEETSAKTTPHAPGVNTMSTPPGMNMPPPPMPGGIPPMQNPMPSMPGNPALNNGAPAKAPASSSAIQLKDDGSLSPDALSGLLKLEQLTKFPVASFQDSNGTYLSVPFSDSCLLVYPDQHVEFTIVHSVVVRIHIGKGVKRPDTPIPPAEDATTTGNGSGPGGPRNF